MFGSLLGGRAAQAENLITQAKALISAGRRDEAVACIREAFRLQPESASACSSAGMLLDAAGESEEARRLLTRAAELEPSNPDVRLNLRVVSTRHVPMWHFSMMNDARRNDAYERALEATVRPGSLVLEIGTGSGLVAMMAARGGAARVVTCEKVAPVADAARSIIARNGYADRIDVVTADSSVLRIPDDLPAPADLLVSEIVSADLIGEGLLDVFADARRLLDRHASLIPARAWVRGQLVEAPDLAPFVAVGEVAGFDLSDFNRFAPLKVHPSEVPVTFDPLGEPFDAWEFDLARAEMYPASRRTLRSRVLRSGRCVGVMQWVRLQLAEEIFYENSPESGSRSAGHWQPVIHLFDSPAELREGEMASVVTIHNRSSVFFRLGSDG